MIIAKVLLLPIIALSRFNLKEDFPPIFPATENRKIFAYFIEFFLSKQKYCNLIEAFF